MTIDWGLIQNAERYYGRLGYKLLDVPWLVPQKAVRITMPEDRRSFDTFAGSLVASGEQSLLAIRDRLPPGRHQCTTPCFRDEPALDDLHRPWFVKNELMYVLRPGDTPSPYVEEVLADAYGFFAFRTYGVASEDVKRVKTADGYDIEIHGVEVGSYGYREYGGFRWVYGTGCAEPRLSQAIEAEG